MVINIVTLVGSQQIPVPFFLLLYLVLMSIFVDLSDCESKLFLQDPESLSVIKIEFLTLFDFDSGSLLTRAYSTLPEKCFSFYFHICCHSTFLKV